MEHGGGEIRASETDVLLENLPRNPSSGLCTLLVYASVRFRVGVILVRSRVAPEGSVHANRERARVGATFLYLPGRRWPLFPVLVNRKLRKFLSLV